MKKILTLAIGLSLLQGCLWVVRVPVPRDTKYADDGTITNRVWRSPVRDIAKWRCYPILWMRLTMTKELWKSMVEPVPDGLKGEDLARARDCKQMAPLGIVVAWAGLPLDLVVDTLCLPFDLMESSRKEEIQ